MIQSTRFLAVALTVGVLVSAPRSQQELGGFEAAKVVELEHVRQQPQAFKNVWVSFNATFLGLGAVHNPFFTRFTRASFVNFAAWDDSQQIWKKDEYDNPCSTLFCAKKNSDVLQKLYNYKRYTPIKITAVIRNAWQGEPWFEVTEIEVASDTRLTTATLSHMHRAWSLIEDRKWQQASIELNLASSKKMPNFAQGWWHAYTGLCQMRTGRPESAQQQLEAAGKLVARNSVIEGWLDQVVHDPRDAIDSETRVTSIRRGDRPMWEAVDMAESSGDTMKRGGLRSSKRTTKPGATPKGSTKSTRGMKRTGTSDTKTKPSGSTTEPTKTSTPGSSKSKTKG